MNENLQNEDASLLDWFEEKHPEGNFKNESTDFDHSHQHIGDEHKIEFLVHDMFLDHFFP